MAETAVIPSSIAQLHDLEITEHGLGFDLAQNGLVIHIDHSQIEEVVKSILKTPLKIETRR